MRNDAVSPSLEQTLRSAVIAEALSWVGTGFHHMGRLKCRRDATGAIVDRGGVDCAQSVYLIYRAAVPQRVPEFAIAHYAFAWNLARRTAEQERYLATVLAHAREIDTPQPGDLALFRMGLAFAHGAIVMPPGWPSIAHATLEAGGFILDRADLGRLSRCRRRFFTVW